MNRTTNTLTDDRTIDSLLSDLTGPWGVEETATGAVLTYNGEPRRPLDSVCDAKDLARTLNRHHPPTRTLNHRGAELLTRAYPARFPRLADVGPRDFAAAHKDAEPRDVVGQLYLRVIPADPNTEVDSDWDGHSGPNRAA